MKAERKIDLLKEALNNGNTLSPLDAWSRWHMQANTFNRQIWELKHHHAMPIISVFFETSDRTRFKCHRLDKGVKNAKV